MSAAFCDACGRPAAEGEHGGCARRRGLEPPRYCPHCARRMVVQVTPSGWSARCSAHGAVGTVGTVTDGAGRDPELV